MSDKKSGHVGVIWHKGKGKWMAYIGRAGKQKYLGVFDNVKDAIAAREKAELEFPLPHRKRKNQKLNMIHKKSSIMQIQICQIYPRSSGFVF